MITKSSIFWGIWPSVFHPKLVNEDDRVVLISSKRKCWIIPPKLLDTQVKFVMGRRIILHFLVVFHVKFSKYTLYLSPFPLLPQVINAYLQRSHLKRSAAAVIFPILNCSIKLYTSTSESAKSYFKNLGVVSHPHSEKDSQRVRHKCHLFYRIHVFLH